MERHDKHLGWLFAAFTVLVWGSTFISSKKLLQLYTPSQIMLMRFLLAYAALWLLRPRRMKLSPREEGAFLLMGLAGCSLYFYTENTALTHTLAANVSIIVAAAPIFTAILAHFVGEERFSRRTLLGFLIAFTGVILVVFNGAFVLKLDPRGDLLALGAAACWAVYSILLRRMGGRHDPLLVTRRTLFWGTVTAIPIVLLEGAPFPTAPLATLFLGLIGSGLCYVLWNHTVRLLGVVSANNFIYLIPFVTIVAAALFLDETISPIAILGAALITAGVVVTQRETPLLRRPTGCRSN